MRERAADRQSDRSLRTSVSSSSVPRKHRRRQRTGFIICTGGCTGTVSYLLTGSRGYCRGLIISDGNEAGAGPIAQHSSASRLVKSPLEGGAHDCCYVPGPVWVGPDFPTGPVIQICNVGMLQHRGFKFLLFINRHFCTVYV